jgi:hypothetical protein
LLGATFDYQCGRRSGNFARFFFPTIQAKKSLPSRGEQQQPKKTRVVVLSVSHMFW